MTDTPDHIYDKQIEIRRSFTEEKRARIAVDLIDTCYSLVVNRLRREHPDYTKGELMYAVFEEFYSDEFSAEEKQRIRISIVNYHDNPDRSNPNHA